jgi:phosphomannomutase/phosphoglucomutase
MTESTLEKIALAPLSDSIFRSYDIRGIVDVTLTEEALDAIGQAFGALAQEKGIHQLVVAYDGRLSSPRLSQVLIQSLLKTGMTVLDIGLVPTPVLYFATYYLETGTGIMLTGSHNPAEYNGLKMMLDGRTLLGSDIQALKIRAQKFYTNAVTPAKAGAQSKYKHTKLDVTQAYKARITQDISLKRPLKIVIDGGNGAGSLLVPEVLTALGCEVIPLFCTIDGHFPNHHPDPTNPHNLIALIQKVQETGADLGLALDGDGDRLGLVTEKGEIIWADRQLMLLAQDVLTRNPGTTIVFDVKCSRYLAALIQQKGGKPIMAKTGHSFIKATMKETQALLAGEMSGHIFFQERWYGFDDACYAAARLLEIVSGTHTPVSELFNAFPNGVNTPELHIAISDDKKFPFMEKLLAEGDFGEGVRVTIDGLRVEYPYGWGLIRVSNTTPNLVCRFEADTPEQLAQLKQNFKTEIIKTDASLTVLF